MKQITKQIVILVLLFVCVIFSVSVQLNLNKKSRKIVNGIIISSEYNTNITFSDCEKKDKSLKFSALSLEDSFITTEYFTTPEKIELTYTNKDFARIVPLNIRYGNYFEINNIPELNNNIVISNELALKLFKTYDGVGRKVIINNKEYIVCGVYVNDKSFLSKISSNGKQRVFIPYMCAEKYNEIPIKQLFSEKGTNIFPESIIDSIKQDTEKAILYDETIDFTNTERLTKQGMSVSFFILGINIIAFLVYYLCKKVKYTYVTYQNNNNKKLLAVNSLICFGFFTGIIIVLLIVKFKFFIPNAMLPADNVFDFKFYYKVMLEKIQKINRTSMDLYYTRYSFNVLKSSVVWSFVSSIFLIIIWWYGVYFTKKAYKLYKDN